MRTALLIAAVSVACKATPAPPAPIAEKHAGSGVVAAATPVTVQKPGFVEGSTVKPHREDPVVECPVSETGLDDDARVPALLDEANKQIEKGNFGAAWTCADRAADLAPQAVEAHHLRGAALAALGRDGEAQVAFGIALALDPDDPETLRAVADYYINGKGERSRDALRLGLELAQRGSRRAAARRRTNAPLTADLEVLEGQALNDLGRSDEAVARIDAALKLAPGRGDALHEKGVALFDLSKFEGAKAALQKALALQPNDAYTHQMLGLTLEQLGDATGADTEQKRALELAPGELWPPVLISKAEFQKEVDAVLATLPADRLARVKQVPIEIVDLPEASDLAAVTPPFPPTILGLYRGPVGHGAKPGEDPQSIVLYRKNLARAVKTRGELAEQIRDTLLHEIGHLEGLDEDDLRRRGME